MLSTRHQLVLLLAFAFSAAACDDTSGSGGASSSTTTTSSSTSKASTGTASMNACQAWADAENAVGAMLGCTPDPDHIQGCEGPRASAGMCTDEFDAVFACAAKSANTANCSCDEPDGSVGCLVAPCQAESDAYYQCGAPPQSSSASGG